MNHPQQSKGFQGLSRLLKIWRFLKPQRRAQVCFAFVLMVISGFAEFFTLAAVIPFLSSLFEKEIRSPSNLDKSPVSHIPGFIGSSGSQDGFLISSAALLFALAVVFSVILRLLNLWYGSRLAATIGSDLSCRVYEIVLNRDYSAQLMVNSSSVINTLTLQVSRTIVILKELLQAASSTLISLFLIAAFVWINPAIACIMFSIFATAYVAIAVFTRNRLLANSMKISSKNREQIKAIQEGMGAIRDIILDNSQLKYINFYRSKDLPVRLLSAQSSFLAGFPRFSLEGVSLLLVIFITIALVSSGTSPLAFVPLLATYALGAQKLLPCLQQVYGSWATISSNYASLNEVVNVLHEGKPRVAPQDITPVQITYRSNLYLKNISFSYTGQTDTIDDLSLLIQSGQTIGLIGPTGSGKSTTVDLVMGLLLPKKGHFFVDGYDLYSEDCRKNIASWQSTISHVPQSIYLTDSSILDNIALSSQNQEVDLQRIYKAAKAAHIHNFIKALPDSYQTPVGERGVRLSGGQIQRIGIARALYKQSKLLILDEATSALDTYTEKLVMNSISSFNENTTIIMIAHRLTTLAVCDWVYEFSAGRIIRRLSGYEASQL